MDEEKLKQMLEMCKAQGCYMFFISKYDGEEYGIIKKITYEKGKVESVLIDREEILKKVYSQWYKENPEERQNKGLTTVFPANCEQIRILKETELGNYFCWEGNGYWNRYEDEKHFSKTSGRRAFLVFRLSALLGYPMGMNNLGCCYEHGVGVKKDGKKAVKWYKKAAKQGLGLAASNLGSAYYNGKIVKRNLKKAVKWWHLGAKLKDVDAMMEMGVCYKKGEYVKKDNYKAYLLWEEAAHLGHNIAQNYYARAFYYGEGIGKDEISGIYWMKVAAVNGNKDARKWLKKWHVKLQSRYDKNRMLEDACFDGTKVEITLRDGNTETGNVAVYSRPDDNEDGYSNILFRPNGEGLVSINEREIVEVCQSADTLLAAEGDPKQPKEGENTEKGGASVQ